MRTDNNPTTIIIKNDLITLTGNKLFVSTEHHLSQGELLLQSIKTL